MMKKAFIGLILLFASTIGAADDIDLSWTAPAYNEDCVVAGPVSGLAGFRIYQLVADINDPSVTGVTLSDMQPGVYTYRATAYNTSGEESRMSGSVDKTAVTFAVTNPTAYYVIQQPDRFLLLPVGTVPVGTACDVSHEVNEFYAVPRSEVTYTDPNGPKPFVMVARCG